MVFIQQQISNFEWEYAISEPIARPCKTKTTSENMRQIDYIDVYMNVYSHEMKS